MGRLIAIGGVALALFGLAYASGCDFETANVCRPLGLLGEDSSWNVQGSGGLLITAGLALVVAGACLALFRMLARKRS